MSTIADLKYTPSSTTASDLKYRPESTTASALRPYGAALTAPFVQPAPMRQTNPYSLFSDYDLWFIYNMMQDQWYWYGVHFTDRGYEAFVRNYRMAEEELRKRGMIR